MFVRCKREPSADNDLVVSSFIQSFVVEVRSLLSAAFWQLCVILVCCRKAFPCLFGDRFATSRIVRAYLLLLKNYEHNSVSLNHCIVKMLYRIAHDCELMPLLLQLSSISIFCNILNDPAAHSKHMTVCSRSWHRAHTKARSHSSNVGKG